MSMWQLQHKEGPTCSPSWLKWKRKEKTLVKKKPTRLAYSQIFLQIKEKKQKKKRKNNDTHVILTKCCWCRSYLFVRSKNKSSQSINYLLLPWPPHSQPFFALSMAACFFTGEILKKDLKMKWFWRFSVARSEREQISKNHQISIFGFAWVAISIEGWLKGLYIHHIWFTARFG
jgi:hypothetical protein